MAMIHFELILHVVEVKHRLITLNIFHLASKLLLTKKSQIFVTWFPNPVSKCQQE